MLTWKPVLLDTRFNVDEYSEINRYEQSWKHN